jgi:hypothetical protein
MNNYYDLFKNCKLNEKYKIIIIDKMFYLKLPINYDFQMLQIRKITLFDRKLLNNKDSNRYKSYIYRPIVNKTSKKVKIDKSKLFYISKINIVFNLHRGISTKIWNQSIKRKRNFFSNTDNKIICQLDSNISVSEKVDSKSENNNFLPVLQQNKK